MRLVARLGLIVVVGVVVVVTLTPHDLRTPTRADRAIGSINRRLDLPANTAPPAQRRAADVAGNVALFFPLGLVALAAFRGHRLAVAVAGPLLSGAIEMLQGLYLPHRYASVRDVAANSAGYVLGLAVAAAFSRVRARRPRPPVLDSAQ